MERPAPEEWAAVTPADLMHSVARRMPSVMVTTVLVAAIVALVLVCWPNRYISDGMMYVRLGRGAVSVDPTAQGAKSVSLHESRRPEVDARVEEEARERKHVDGADLVVSSKGKAATANLPR